VSQNGRQNRSHPVFTHQKKIIFKFLKKNILKDAIHRQRSFWLVSAKIVVLDVAESLSARTILSLQLIAFNSKTDLLM
jgi:hypothetical protein